MMLTRRAFGLSAASLPLAAALPAVANPDVVVVGAGVAGLAAARTLMDGGRRVQVIEAAARTGGRCYTDSATLGVPFDCGASVLRDAERNPLVGFARLYRFHASMQRGKSLLMADGRVRPPDDVAAWERSVDAVSMALAEAAEEDDLIAAAQVELPVLDDDARTWTDTAIAQVGPFSQGVSMADLSVRDWLYRDEAEPEMVLREGVGTLVGRLAEGIPVSVNTRALAISSIGGGVVRVDTSRGSIRTGAVIVTVSPAVLASGSIAFDPALPTPTRTGLAGLAMGHVCRAALRFRRGSPALRFGTDLQLIPKQTPEEAHRFEVGDKGSSLVAFTAGGALATRVEGLPQRDAVELILGLLRRAAGSDADQGFEAACISDWQANPLSLGSFACALPAAPRARDLLMQPVHDRVFLAGEALAERAKQTVHGAHESGRRAARRVLSVLRRASR